MLAAAELSVESPEQAAALVVVELLAVVVLLSRTVVPVTAVLGKFAEVQRIGFVQMDWLQREKPAEDLSVSIRDLAKQSHV